MVSDNISMSIYPESITNLVLILIVTSMPATSHGDSRESSPTEKVVLATHDYSPYYNNQDKGLLADLYRAAFQAVNLDVEFRAYPIGRGVQFLALDKVDATSPGRILTDVTEWSDYIFVDVLKIQICWIYYAPYFQGKNPPKEEDVKNHNLSIINFSPYRKLYDQQQLNYITVTNPEQHIRLLRGSRVQFSELTRIAGLWTAGIEFVHEKEQFKCIPWKIDEIGLAFNGNSLRSKRLAALFRQGLESLKKDGIYIEILERYWGKNNIPKELLPDELKRFGTASFDTSTFYSESIVTSIK